MERDFVRPLTSKKKTLLCLLPSSPLPDDTLRSAFILCPLPPICSFRRNEYNKSFHATYSRRKKRRRVAEKKNQHYIILSGRRRRRPRDAASCAQDINLHSFPVSLLIFFFFCRLSSPPPPAGRSSSRIWCRASCIRRRRSGGGKGRTTTSRRRLCSPEPPTSRACSARPEPERTRTRVRKQTLNRGSQPFWTATHFEISGASPHPLCSKHFARCARMGHSTFFLPDPFATPSESLYILSTFKTRCDSQVGNLCCTGIKCDLTMT